MSTYDEYPYYYDPNSNQDNYAGQSAYPSFDQILGSTSTSPAGARSNPRHQNKLKQEISSKRHLSNQANLVSRAKKKRSRKKTLGQRVRAGVLGVFSLLVLLCIGCAGFIIAVYATTSIPKPDQFAKASITTLYYNDSTTQMGTLASVNRTVVDTTSLPAYVSRAVVASEDQSFYTNSGLDLKGILRALWNNLTSDSRQGGSTITQQYVENYYVGETTTDIYGKVKEAILAVKINKQQSKSQILDNYLNTIYFGRGAYGIEEAAKAYFGKSASELTLSEAALLAGIIPSPSTWDPQVNYEQAYTRWQRVLDLMVQYSYISIVEANQQEFPSYLDYTTTNSSSTYAWEGYLTQQAKTELIDKQIFTEEQLLTGGYTIITTIDYDLQLAAQEAVEVMPSDTPEGLRIALSCIDNETGEIVAEYAGEDYSVIQSNAVTQDIAQAGSTFKPFALIAYAQQGGSVYDRYDGKSPQVFYDVTVRNNENVSYGKISLVQATRNSVNTAFVNLNDEVGATNTYNTLIAAGIPADTYGLDDTLLNVLGYASPHNLDLATAYATIANGGKKVDSHIVRQVIDSSGSIVYQASTSQEQVFTVSAISSIMPALEAVTSEGGTGSKVTKLKAEVAGKTGTSENQLSAQFVAFTPKYTTAVSMYQVGEDGSAQSLTNIGGLSQFHGSDWPTDVWVAFMKVANQGHEKDEFSWYK